MTETRPANKRDEEYESPFLGPMTGKLGETEAWGDDEIDELEPPSQKKKIQDYANRKLPVMLDILIFLIQLIIFLGYFYMTFFYGDLNTI